VPPDGELLLPQPWRIAAVAAQTMPTNIKLCKVLKTESFFSALNS
jgi:hypothetical protein